ncbi:hypothetical protein [Herbaspirillum aquaticum]|uniref:Uncharacterized protein n=1 Tax=Herbaspirillum huttiense subsp. nephrolepidis TaxID=3075126 RepID=A0AAE4GA67_9BURK|nr:hypothetical protein [Herbaspirillum aquaticum]
MKPATMFSEFVLAAKQAPQLYFAPLVGAYKALIKAAQSRPDTHQSQPQSE